MGEVYVNIVSLLLSWVLVLEVLSTFLTGDQVVTLHQALREAGRAAANYPAPQFDPSTQGTGLQSDLAMVDEPYLTFKAALATGVPNATIDSLIYQPVSSVNPEDIQVTAVVEVPRFAHNYLALIGGPSFSPTVKHMFSVMYYREWDYNEATGLGAQNPSTNGPAQSN